MLTTVVLLLFGLAVSVPTARSAVYTWAGGTGEWTNAASWTPNIAGGPVAGDSIVNPSTDSTRMNINSTAVPSVSLVDLDFSQMGGGGVILNNSSTGGNTSMTFAVTGTLTKATANALDIRGHSGGTMSVSLHDVNVSGGNLRLGADFVTDARYGLTGLTVSGTLNVSSNGIFTIATAPGVTASLQQVNLSNTAIVRLSATGGSNRVREVTMTGLSGVSGTEVQGNTLANTGSSFTTLTINSTPGTTSTFAGLLRNGTAAGHYLNLVKAGAGTQVLSGSNTYTGTTTLAAGTLRVGNDAALGAGGFAINGGVFASDSATARTITNAVTMGGNVQFGDATGTGALTLSSSIDLGATTRTFTISNTSTAVGGVVSNGGLTKQGIGTLVLAAANTYAGATTVNAGTLTVTHGNALGDTAAGTTVASAAQLRLGATNSGFTVGAEALTLSGQGVTTGGALRNAAGDNTWQGNITLAANATIGAADGTSLTIDVSSGNAITAADFSLTFDGAGTNRVLDAINLGTGAVTKTGSGIAILGASNIYSGGTSLTNGTLRLDHANAAGTGSITQSNGTFLQINTTGTVANAMSIFNVQTMQTVTLSGNKTLNNATYTVDGGTTTTESGVLSGDGGITKLGTGTLLVTASNTFTGTVDVQAGLLSLASATGSAAGGTTNVIVATNATLLIALSDQVNNTAAVTLSGGTIQRASGVSEVFGNLNVSSASFLDFGSGTEGTLSFGTYTASALLTVNNFFEGNVLTFGTDLSSSINNTNSFKFDNAFTSSWNQGTSTFTITAIPEPSTYVAALGLLGLLVLSLRRRAASRSPQSPAL